MKKVSTELGFSKNTRRWPRYPADLEIRIVALNGIPTIPVLARGSEISTAGMAVRAAINVRTGDVMQLQFPTSKRVMAVVRNRNSDCFGLEFLTQLLQPPENKLMSRPTSIPTGVLRDLTELRKSAHKPCNPTALYAGLHRKQEELRKLQTEIEALKLAIPLLAGDQNEPSRLSSCEGPLSVSPAMPWPKPRHFEDATKSKVTPRTIS